LGAQKVDPAEARPLDEERYWIAATKAESFVALGDPSGPGLMDAALASAPAPWTRRETRWASLRRCWPRRRLERGALYCAASASGVSAAAPVSNCRRARRA